MLFAIFQLVTGFVQGAGVCSWKMSGAVNQDELVGKFADIASTDSERSRFYLEAAGWDLEVEEA